VTAPPKDNEAARLVERLLRPGSGGRIRCPGCKWQPDKDSLSMCERSCQHVWNTFDTRARRR
jgi:hypothetical protein